MSVSAIIVTRGDVDLLPIVSSIPDEWEILIWVNGNACWRWAPGRNNASYAIHVCDVADLSVYGRYAAIQYASHDLIYVQDDDCIVSDPAALARANKPGRIVANMPQEFRPHYPDSCLVGFGACFHRDLPARAFNRLLHDIGWPGSRDSTLDADWYAITSDFTGKFKRTCDVVFTTLTPRVLVDVPVEVLPYAHDANRMWKQPDHYGERTRVLEMARKVRDAS